MDIRDINKLKDIYGDEDYTLVEKDEYVAKLQLPSEFKQLYFSQKDLTLNTIRQLIT